MRDFLILACVGALGGLITGLLGIGGGVLFILGLAIVFKEKGKKEKIFPTSVAAVLPISAATLVSYYLNGSLNINDSYGFIIPSVLGGAIGAFLYGKIKLDSVKKIFAIIVIYSGLSMLFS